jgi:ubiquinone/menaquinone biosynthesis C-methylase UbiE
MEHPQSERMTDDRNSVAAYYDDAARDWDAGHADRQNPVFRQRLHDCVRSLLEPVRGRELAIELGAGTGPYLSIVAPMFRRLVCTDISDGMLGVLEQRRDRLGLSNVYTLRADATELAGIPDRSADAVYSVGMFETVSDPERVFAVARRVLRPNGVFAGITSNGDCPWYRLRRQVEGGERPGQIVRYMTAREVRSFAANAGFQISVIDCWGAVPPGLSNRLLAGALDALGSALHATFLAGRLGLLAFRLVSR